MSKSLLPGSHVWAGPHARLYAAALHSPQFSIVNMFEDAFAEEKVDGMYESVWLLRLMG